MQPKFYLDKELLKATKFGYKDKIYYINNPEELAKILKNLETKNELGNFTKAYKENKVIIGEKYFKQEESKQKNTKIYFQNITKKMIAIYMASTIIATGLTGCQTKETCKITEKHNHIYKNDKEIEYLYQDCEYEQENYQKTNSYILEDELGNYLKQHNLYKISELKEGLITEINQKENFIQSKKAIPYIKKNGELGFKIKWKLLSDEIAKEYTGIARQGTKENLKYKIYKVEKEDKKYKKTSSIVETLEEKEDYYIDIEDFIVLENQEQNYYIKGKVRTKN